MGHEIAHAVARHSIERASQAMTVNLGTSIADIFLGGAINRTRNTVGRNTGLDIFQIGIMNPFGRKRVRSRLFRTIFFSLSGFDIRVCKLWKECLKIKRKVPIFSTHPSSKE